MDTESAGKVNEQDRNRQIKTDCSTEWSNTEMIEQPNHKKNSIWCSCRRRTSS